MCIKVEGYVSSLSFSSENCAICTFSLLLLLLAINDRRGKTAFSLHVQYNACGRMHFTFSATTNFGTVQENN